MPNHIDVFENNFSTCEIYGYAVLWSSILAKLRSTALQVSRHIRIWVPAKNDALFAAAGTLVRQRGNLDRSLLSWKTSKPRALVA